MRLSCGFCVASRSELLSRQLGVEIFRLEQWREKAIAGIDASLKERKGDPVKVELDSRARWTARTASSVWLKWGLWKTCG